MNMICLELFSSDLVQKVKFFTDWWTLGISPGSEWYSDMHWVSQDQHWGFAGSQSCPREYPKPGGRLSTITITMKHPSTCYSSVTLCLHWLGHSNSMEEHSHITLKILISLFWNAEYLVIFCILSKSNRIQTPSNEKMTHFEFHLDPAKS